MRKSGRGRRGDGETGRKGPKISAFVMVKDGQRSITRCVESLGWADEVVVLDTGSRDQTLDLARKAGARVRRAAWEGFSKTRNKGIRDLKGRWILVLDADEWLENQMENGKLQMTNKFGEEAFRRAAREGEFSAYTLPRRTSFLGKPIRWGGWGRDRQLRFFRKGAAWFDEGKAVHEGALAKGEVGRLDVMIEHDSYPDLRSYLAKMDMYTALAAEDLASRPLALPPVRMVFLPPWIFLKMALFRLGFLDGWRGLLLALLSGVNEALKDWRAL